MVLSAFVAMVLALALIWDAARGGGIVALATGAASHGTGAGVVAFLRDVSGF